MDNKNIKKYIKNFFVWFGLIIITIVLCVIAYATFTQNGELAISMIYVLIMISVLYWLGIRFFKRQQFIEDYKHREEKQKEMNDIAHFRTKDV